MNIHKYTKLIPLQREEIYLKRNREHIRVALLLEKYRISRPTIHKVLARDRRRNLSVHNSCNAHFRCPAVGYEALDQG